MDERSEVAAAVVSPHLEPGEVLREAVAGYSYMGFSRLVVGVTDRRVLAVRSSYWTLSGKRLLWADPLDEVKMRSKVHVQKTVGGIKNGNATVFLRRANNKSFVFNPRSSWISGNARANASKLSEVLVSL